MRPCSSVSRMPSITLPFSASGWEAASTPSTASRFGAEKDFLGRHVRHEADAALRRVRARHPDMFIRQTDDSVRSQRIFISYLLELQGVQSARHFLQIRAVRAPRFHRVAALGDANRAENRLPQLFHRRVVRIVREDLLRPIQHRHADHAPREAVRHHRAMEFLLVAPRRRFPAAEPVRRYPAQILRVARRNGNEARAFPPQLHVLFNVPRIHRVEYAVVRVQPMLPAANVVAPFHHNVLRTQLKACRAERPPEISAIHRAAHHDGLPLLHVDADPGHQLRILLQ